MKLSIAACAMLLVIATARASTGTPASAEDIFQLVSAALAIDDSDEAIARQVQSVRLTERLDGEAIQILKTQGAGPRTLHALDELRARSASLPPAAQPVVVLDAGLDAQQQTALLGRITEYAAGYMSALPNMSCTESTRFSTSGHESGIRGPRKVQAKLTDGWRLEDIVVEDLDYYEGKEAYHTRKLNGAPDTRPLEEIRAAYSRGEFGTILAITFAPSSQARFQWDHWESLHGRRLAVFNYSIDRVHSQYDVCCVEMGSITVNGVTNRQKRSWISAYRGSVYADADTGSIMQFTFQNVEIPEAYRLQENRNLLEYSMVMLGGKPFWLPKRAIHYTRRADGRTRDEIQFSNYRKFGADTTIQFPTEEK